MAFTLRALPLLHPVTSPTDTLRKHDAEVQMLRDATAVRAAELVGTVEACSGTHNQYGMSPPGSGRCRFDAHVLGRKVRRAEHSNRRSSSCSIELELFTWGLSRGSGIVLPFICTTDTLTVQILLCDV